MEFCSYIYKAILIKLKRKEEKEEGSWDILANVNALVDFVNIHALVVEAAKVILELLYIYTPINKT